MTKMTVSFEKYAEEIMERAIKKGIVKTKIEALRLGLLGLDDRYDLHEEEEDACFNRIADKVMARVRSGKEKLYTEEDIRKWLKKN